jgi:tetratricopeptide (TPR) repeat protein
MLHQEYPRSDAVAILGAVYYEQGDLETAIRYWEESLNLDPANTQLHGRAQTLSNLGEALRARGDFERAERMLREALELNPRIQENRHRLAHLLYEQNRTEACLEVLEAGEAEASEAHRLRGQVYQRLGQLDKARSSFEEAIRKDPKSTEAYYGLATVCARLGEQAEASKHRARFAELKSEEQATGREIRRVYDPLHNTRQSFAQTHTQVAWVYQAKGRPERAETLWKRAAEVDPGNTAARFHLLMAYQRSGRNREAIAICEEMIRAEPTQAMHYLSLGNLKARLLQQTEAESAYRTALELAPDRPEPCFALAQFLLQNDTNTAEAVRLAQRAVDLSPAAPHYHVLARAFAQVNNRTAALAASQKACELDPGNPQYERLRKTLLTSTPGQPEGLKP